MHCKCICKPHCKTKFAVTDNTHVAEQNMQSTCKKHCKAAKRICTTFNWQAKAKHLQKHKLHAKQLALAICKKRPTCKRNCKNAKNAQAKKNAKQHCNNQKNTSKTQKKCTLAHLQHPQMQAWQCATFAIAKKQLHLQKMQHKN